MDGDFKYASKGVAGAGLGLGIAGTALGLMNGNGCGLNGLFGGYNRNGCGDNAYETKEAAMLREQVATLTSERYADTVATDTFKAMVGYVEKLNDKITANQRDTFVALADLDKNQAVQMERSRCQEGQIQSILHRLNGITKEVVPASAVCPAPMPLYNSWEAPREA